MLKIKYKNKFDFHTQLLKLMKDGERIKIKTDYEFFDEIPKDIKELFELDHHQNLGWINRENGLFIKNFVMDVGFRGEVLINKIDIRPKNKLGLFAEVAGANIKCESYQVDKKNYKAHDCSLNRKVEVEIDEEGRLNIIVESADFQANND